MRSDVKGVFWKPRYEHYAVALWYNSVQYSLGCFRKKEKAERIAIEFRKTHPLADLSKVVSRVNKTCGPRRKSKSKYKGLTWVASSRKWRACIGLNGKVVHLGYYHSETAGALAYDRAAKENWGNTCFQNAEYFKEDF